LETVSWPTGGRFFTLEVAMKLRWFSLFVALSWIVPAGAAQDKTGDKEKLQGTWAGVSGVENGKAMPAEDIKNVRLVFVGDKLKVTVKGKDFELAGTYTLDPTKKPKAVDVDFGDKKKGTGIYELDGDTLKIAHGDFGDPRPKDFVSKEGSHVTVMVLKREK
jgi:uncharacterized protein (TIGR03067 family)